MLPFARARTGSAGVISTGAVSVTSTGSGVLVTMTSRQSSRTARPSATRTAGRARSAAPARTSAPVPSSASRSATRSAAPSARYSQIAPVGLAVTLSGARSRHTNTAHPRGSSVARPSSSSPAAHRSRHDRTVAAGPDGHGASASPARAAEPDEAPDHRDEQEASHACRCNARPNAIVTHQPHPPGARAAKRRPNEVSPRVPNSRPGNTESLDLQVWSTCVPKWGPMGTQVAKSLEVWSSCVPKRERRSLKPGRNATWRRSRPCPRRRGRLVDMGHLGERARCAERALETNRPSRPCSRGLHREAPSVARVPV